MAFFSVANFFCTNIDLLDHLENPGTKERFTTKNYLFITSWMVQGNIAFSPFSECAGMTGVMNADCSCTRAAAANGLRKSSSHQFVAVLSTGSGNIYDFRCKIQGLTQGSCIPIAATAPWFDTQGGTVAANLDLLLNASNPIGVQFTENGSVPGTDLAWTGSTTTAINSTFNCGDWSLNTNVPTGTAGNRNGASGAWLDSATPNCDTTQRLYCAGRIQ